LAALRLLALLGAGGDGLGAPEPDVEGSVLQVRG